MDHLRGIEFVEKVENDQAVVPREIYVEKYRNSPEQLKAAEITVCEAEVLSDESKRGEVGSWRE